MATRWRWPPDKLARLALQQVAQLQDLGGLVHARLDLVLGHLGDLQAVGHVVEHAHVRVQRVVLEHHGDVALGRLQVVDDRPPMEISPPEISSSPATMRSSVDLPQPDGPTMTMNSPSAISAFTPWMTWLAACPRRSA
jgi:hypothetical protein